MREVIARMARRPRLLGREGWRPDHSPAPPLKTRLESDMCDSCPSFLDRLFAKGVLHATGVDGLYARGECFENVISGLDRVISRHGAAHRAEIIRFPPGMSRALFEKSGYMNSFPQLAGSIHGFVGDERDHLALLDKIHNGERWTDRQVATTSC